MNSANWHARISVAALCAMLTLPFLDPHHFRPITTFFQEWTAATCGLLAATLLLKKQMIEHLEVPAIALLPLCSPSLPLA